MKKRLIALSLLTAMSCVLRGGATTPAEDRLWATRITCELQTAGPASLPALYWQQGTSPLLSFDQYRSGRAVDADTNVTAVLRLAPTATNLIGWVSVTNYATVGNGYLVQMPSVGTNTTASGAWWYTAYFIRGTAVYWTGSGRVTITATTSTGADGLVWHEILPPGSVLKWEEITDKPATFPPDAHTHPHTDITDPPWLTSFTEQDEIALQAIFTHSNNGSIHLSTEQAERIANALTNELDLAALRAYHYGSPDIVESPTNWFVFDGAGTITVINSASVTNWNIVIPWAIGGVPVTGIGDGAFSDCTSLTSVAIPNSVTSIGSEAFQYCCFLTSVTIPNTVTSIGYSAFFYCTALTSVTIPDSVTSIGDYAFYYCTALTSVTIGNNITSIGSSAFRNCTYLTSLYFDGNAPTIGPGIFAEITANQVTNYVTNPTATGWGDKLGGMPVVRMPLFADSLTIKGTNVEDRITAKVNAAAATADAKYVAKAGFPSGGCKDLGTATNLVVDGTSIYYTAAPASAYTITVSQPVSSGYTYCLTTYSDSPITLVNADLRNAWVLGGTNTLVFYPGTTNRWFVKGSAP